MREPYNGNYIQRHPWITTSFVVIVGTLILGIFIPSIQAYPKEFTITTGPFWSDAMKYINVNFFDAFEAIKVFFLQSLLLPVKKFFVGIPWAWGVIAIGLFAWKLAGWRMGILAFFLMSCLNSDILLSTILVYQVS